jgi:hypothetical protein
MQKIGGRSPMQKIGGGGNPGAPGSAPSYEY